MGRRKDNPLEQAAKGFPGRRKSAVEKEIAAVAEAAEAVPLASSDPFPLPTIFVKAPAYWGEAARIWAAQSEVLLLSGRRRPGYRHALARYCIWTQLFLAASEQLRRDLPKGGATVKVKKGDGEYVYRTHPNIELMGKAETALRLLEAEFGFTPVRDQDLLRVESFNATQGKFNFNPQQSGAEKPAASGHDRRDDSHDPMDLMTATDSRPPGSLPN